MNGTSAGQPIEEFHGEGLPCPPVRVALNQWRWASVGCVQVRASSWVWIVWTRAAACGGGRGQWASKVGDGKSGGPTGHAYGGWAWWQMRNFNIRSQGMTNPIWLGLGQLWTQWPLLSHGLMTPAAQLFAIPILCSRSQFWKHVFMSLVAQTYSPNCLVRSRMVGVWSQLGQHSKTLCSPPSKIRVYNAYFCICKWLKK